MFFAISGIGYFAQKRWICPHHPVGFSSNQWKFETRIPLDEKNILQEPIFFLARSRGGRVPIQVWWPFSPQYFFKKWRATPLNSPEVWYNPEPPPSYVSWFMSPWMSPWIIDISTINISYISWAPVEYESKMADQPTLPRFQPHWHWPMPCQVACHNGTPQRSP